MLVITERLYWIVIKVIATIGIGYADGINRKMGNGKVKLFSEWEILLQQLATSAWTCVCDIT